ncbi:hypothetical protein GCM10011529_14830 [Polymorphobacter glacialis]|uniref:Uncharacterized protein n=1 Tax=Sandarakinorhabdus glacialis TaxID=1614636 RepID=A0A916ZQU6_9SPHN|nr:hypothetical protein GCM10011529_14830 [Polymorphobacter glacialis]
MARGTADVPTIEPVVVVDWLDGLFGQLPPVHWRLAVNAPDENVTPAVEMEPVIAVPEVTVRPPPLAATVPVTWATADTAVFTWTVAPVRIPVAVSNLPTATSDVVTLPLAVAVALPPDTVAARMVDSAAEGLLVTEICSGVTAVALEANAAPARRTGRRRQRCFKMELPFVATEIGHGIAPARIMPFTGILR